MNRSYYRELLHVRISRTGFLFLGIMVSVILFLLSGLALSAERFIVSIPADNTTRYLQEGDRLAKYTIDISAGRVYGITNLPRDWWIKLKYMESPDVEAFAFHGAGYLTSEMIKKGLFTDFLIIETEAGWGPLDIKADFTIDVLMEENPKHVVIEKKDMVITPLKE